MIVTVMLRDGVEPPRDAPWLTPGTLYTALVIMVDGEEIAVCILGPDGARCEVSSGDVRRLADEWPDDH